jgi:hypothetical protein
VKPLSDKAKGAIGAKLLDVVLRPAIRRLGDKMETARRPFWRNLVGFFRGGKGT